ncbi:MAG: M20/M25/M40 family metallo-hydrolase [Ignavibacteria bacterium]|nr:M20/M25/M40 family metallo-hydrolase [Ignavibacteria bacterium]
MKAIYTIFVVFIIVSSTIFSQVGYSPRIDSISNLVTLQTLSKLNRELCGDTSTIIGGVPYTIVSRHSNTVHNPKAAQFIYERFQSYGLTARYMNYRTNGQNVIATKIGTKYPNQYYIICGHYDNMPSGSLAPGADDNASGTCAVMEAARLLAPFNFDYTLIFVAFDEEEQGLIGSRAYADSSYNRGDSIKGVLNFDMIAWDGNNDYKLNLFTNSASQNFTNITKIAYNIYQPMLDPVVSVGNMSSSDHYYFWQRGYNAYCGIELMSDFHPYYHTVNDNFANVKMPYFLKFTQASLAALMTYGWNFTINFAHTPITGSSDTGPRTASVVITSPYKLKKITNGPRLYYRVNGGSFTALNYVYNNLDTFRFTIPGQSTGANVEYYFAAQDSLANFIGTLPVGGKGLNPPGTVPPATFLQYTVLTAIASNNEPAEFTLSQNYPNPFNPMTNIEFSTGKYSHIRITVSDLLGRETIELVDNYYPLGVHNAVFEGKRYSSGIYFYSMYVDGILTHTKKMMLIK